MRSGRGDRLGRYRGRAVAREPGLPQKVLKAVLRPVLGAWRTTVEGVSRVPESGGVLVAPNHGSYLDHFFLAYRLRRPVNFMAAAELFSNPLVGRLLSTLGAFPVRRGQGDSDAVATAEAIVARGGLVVIYPQGGIRPALEAVPPRKGIGVVAVRTSAPVVPAAIIDATTLHRTGFLKFPRITVRFGERIELVSGGEAADPDQATVLIWERVIALNRLGH